MFYSYCYAQEMSLILVILQNVIAFLPYAYGFPKGNVTNVRLHLDFIAKFLSILYIGLYMRQAMKTKAFDRNNLILCTGVKATVSDERVFIFV